MPRAMPETSCIFVGSYSINAQTDGKLRIERHDLTLQSLKGEGLISTALRSRG